MVDWRALEDDEEEVDEAEDADAVEDESSEVELDIFFRLRVFFNVLKNRPIMFFIKFLKFYLFFFFIKFISMILPHFEVFCGLGRFLLDWVRNAPILTWTN